MLVRHVHRHRRVIAAQSQITRQRRQELIVSRSMPEDFQCDVSRRLHRLAPCEFTALDRRQQRFGAREINAL